MGNKLWGIDIAKIIKEEVGVGVLDATLTKSTPGTRTPGSLTDGTQPTTVSYPCKGFLDTQRVRFMSGTQVRDGSKICLLIGDTINGGDPASAPQPGDRIAIEGTTYQIPVDGEINRDPAAATYECEVRAL